MKKILAFAGSNSSDSINHQLVKYTAGRIQEHEVRVLKLRDYEFPMFSKDHEEVRGIPSNIKLLKDLIDEHDALILSVSENNRMISAFFKNVIDWLSRLDRNFLEGKKILLMSTSPGKRGGAAALEYSKMVVALFGGDVVESFSLPEFHKSFDVEKEIIKNEVFDLGVQDVLTSFVQQIRE